jgi:hypothetical protein
VKRYLLIHHWDINHLDGKNHILIVVLGYRPLPETAYSTTQLLCEITKERV